MVKVVVLGHPHLVLANVARYDGIVWSDAGELANKGRAGDRRQGFFVVGGVEAAGGVPGSALFLPATNVERLIL